jgi:hypothetical protein
VHRKPSAGLRHAILGAEAIIARSALTLPLVAHDLNAVSLAMETISLSHLSQRTRLGSSDTTNQFVDQKDSDPEAGHAAASTSSTAAQWHSRLWAGFETRFPRLAKIAGYVKGPDPKVDLPGTVLYVVTRHIHAHH